MSVFADDLFLAVRRSQLDETRKSIDGEMKIVWGDARARRVLGGPPEGARHGKAQGSDDTGR
eukprot:14651104-Heterocapsa_arctica.AAC.1